MAASSVLDRAGYKQREEKPDVIEPYQTREDVLKALSVIPRDILLEAIAKGPLDAG